jgi:hypothetical protein
MAKPEDDTSEKFKEKIQFAIQGVMAIQILLSL